MPSCLSNVGDSGLTYVFPSSGLKKNYWFVSLFSFTLVVRMEEQLLSSLQVELYTRISLCNFIPFVKLIFSNKYLRIFLKCSPYIHHFSVVWCQKRIAQIKFIPLVYKWKNWETWESSDLCKTEAHWGFFPSR